MPHFNQLPSDVINYTFSFLDDDNLKKARTICRFWRNKANQQTLGRTRLLIKDALDGNLEKVKSHLQAGADVNKRFNFKVSCNVDNIELTNCNILLALVYSTTGFAQFLGIGMSDYISIFKLLIQHKIDVDVKAFFHQYYGFSDFSPPEKITSIVETVACALVGDFYNKDFAALLELRSAELIREDHEKHPYTPSSFDAYALTVERITLAYKTSEKIVSEYLGDIATTGIGLCQQFSEEEKSNC